MWKSTSHMGMGTYYILYLTFDDDDDDDKIWEIKI